MKDHDPQKTFLQKIYDQMISADTSLFLSEFFHHPGSVGSLAPSSKSLGDAMTAFVIADGPKRYLEVGAGTGAFSPTILKKMGSADHLDLVEINPEFCQRLKEKYEKHPQVTVYEGSILDFSPSYRYDVILSSLPFRAFDKEMILNILNHYQALIIPRGILSFYNYMALPGIKKIFLNEADLKAFEEGLEVTQHFLNQHEIKTERVLANFPPAVVHHCRILAK